MEWATLQWAVHCPPIHNKIEVYYIRQKLFTSLNVLVNRMVIMYKIGWQCAQFDNSMILFIPGQNDPKSR